MTESKIGHLRSTRDITLLGLIGTDWRGEREGGRLRVTHKYDVTRPFQKRFCLPFFFGGGGIKKSFICLSIWDNCISDKQSPQIGFSCPERRRHFFYDQDDHKGHHLARKTQLHIRWCKTANSLSLSLIKKDGVFFSSVLYSMFFCVLLGNLSKIKIKKGFERIKVLLIQTGWTTNRSYHCYTQAPPIKLYLAQIYPASLIP